MIIGVHNQDLVFRNVKSRDSYGVIYKALERLL